MACASHAVIVSVCFCELYGSIGFSGVFGCLENLLGAMILPISFSRRKVKSGSQLILFPTFYLCKCSIDSVRMDSLHTNVCVHNILGNSNWLSGFDSKSQVEPIFWLNTLCCIFGWLQLEKPLDGNWHMKSEPIFWSNTLCCIETIRWQLAYKVRTDILVEYMQKPLDDNWHTNLQSFHSNLR